MLNHLYTLEKITIEFQEIIGFKLIEVISQEKDSAVLTFFDNENFRYIKYYGIPHFEAIYMTEKFSKKRSNFSVLFPQITNEFLQDVSLISDTRVICLTFMKYKLYFLLFGNGQNNLILTNFEDVVIDSLENSKELIGTQFKIPPSTLFDLKNLPSDLTIKKALSYSNLLLNQFYSDDFFNLLKIDSNKKVADFSSQEISDIIDKAKEYVGSIRKSQKFYLISNSKGDKFLSLIPLESIGVIEFVSDKASNLVSKVLFFRFQQNKYNDLFKRIKKLAEQDFKGIKKKYDAYANEKMKVQLAEKYREYGDLIYSSPQNLKAKGKAEIILSDFQGTQKKIELNPKLTLIENAEKFYEKSKNSIKSVNIMRMQKQRIEEQYLFAEKRLTELKQCESLSQLEEHIKKYSNFYKVKMAKEDKEISEKFKKFQLSDDAILYVGKDAKNNDELTFGFGKANDYWFHIRGASGSHCVLKYAASGKPPKEIIEKAASIAAYYSSQRNGKYVPVVYTQKKYVRKPKGANAGAVVISKEEVIMVEPKLFETNN